MDANYTCSFPSDFLENFLPSLNISPAISYVQASIALVTGIVGLLLNAFILIIIIKYRSLHQCPMFIEIQITIVEMPIHYLFLLQSVSGIARDWLLGEAMCYISCSPSQRSDGLLHIHAHQKYMHCIFWLFNWMLSFFHCC